MKSVRIFQFLGIGLFLCATTLAQSPLPQSLAEARSLLREQKFEEAEQAFRALTERAPENGLAWLLLGVSVHSQGDYERALPIHLKAAEFSAIAPNARYNAAGAYARLGQSDVAFEHLQKVKESGRVDMRQIETDPDLESLRDDPRFQALLPNPADFEDPFVEDVRTLQEWEGEAQGDQFGWIARNIGDVDSDGVNDVTTSAPTHASGGAAAGKIYVYSGGSGALLWSQTGEPGSQLGLGIEAAGDTNADGIPDVIAGAPGSGKAYVYSGRDGEVLLVFSAEDPADVFGRKVGDLGDIDGDGHADVIVGAPQNDGAAQDAGRAYIYSGKDGSELARLSGEQPGDNFGSSAGGGTRNGNTLIVVGAPNAGPEDRGRAYVSRFKKGSFQPAFHIDADDSGVNLGAMFVSVVGDLDGDGTDDIYASDWHDSTRGSNTGKIYLHSGKDGRRLFTKGGENAGDGFGIGVADAGDINGDGHADLIVGAWQQASAASSGGKVYFYSGRTGDLLYAITCRIPGDTFGFDTTGMGDVDGDGALDFLVTSAWSNITAFRSGRMFILAGRE